MDHPPIHRETVEEQARRASAEIARAARLDRAFAEEDAEIEALRGIADMAYKFSCRHCGSQFSLAQELEQHEGACGQVDLDAQENPVKSEGGPHRCKYCADSFATFGQYGRHRWQAHREAVLAELAERRQQRKADEKKIDAKLKGNGHGAGAVPPSARPSKAVSAPGPTCPTCGGTLPETTAQLVKELAAAGIPEAQAFAVAAVARRVLVVAAGK